MRAASAIVWRSPGQHREGAPVLQASHSFMGDMYCKVRVGNCWLSLAPLGQHCPVRLPGTGANVGCPRHRNPSRSLQPTSTYRGCQSITKTVITGGLQACLTPCSSPEHCECSPGLQAPKSKPGWSAAATLIGWIQTQPLRRDCSTLSAVAPGPRVLIRNSCKRASCAAFWAATLRLRSASMRSSATRSMAFSSAVVATMRITGRSGCSTCSSSSRAQRKCSKHVCSR